MRTQRVQPLVLRGDLTGELAALDVSAGYVVLDLEQAGPALLNFLDGAGHAALLLHSWCNSDAAVVLAQSSS